MKLQVISFNARGLNEDAAVDNMNAYIMAHRTSLDILAIQEHKARVSTLTQLGERIWSNAKTFRFYASVGYDHSA